MYINFFQDLKTSIRLNLKEAKDAVSEKMYKLSATAAWNFVKVKKDLGYAEGWYLPYPLPNKILEKEVAEAEHYLKNQASTKFPKRIEHVTLQWMTSTLHQLKLLQQVCFAINADSLF